MPRFPKAAVGVETLDEPDFRGLFEAAPTPLLVVAPPDWTIVAANNARLRVTGTTRSEQLGRRLFELFPDDPSDPGADGVRNLSASFERVLATRAPDTMAVQRYAVRDAHGRFEERWWSPVNTPVLGTDGEVALIIHRVEEVTDIVRLRGEAEASDQLARGQQEVIARLRATEAELRRSEEFNRRILASSADCIKVLDIDARLEFMSEGGMCVMEVEDFGAIRGACWPHFWPGEGHPKAVEAVAAARAGGTGRFQGFATTMKGNPRWWDVIVTPIDGPDGKPVKLLSVSREVTATKLVEEALRVSEGRLRELNATLERKVAERTAERDRVWQISRDLIAVVGLDGILRAANPAWRTVLGRDPDDLVGRHVRDLAWPEDAVPTRADGGDVSDFLDSEIRYAHRDGTPRWISWASSVEEGLVYAYGRDVTAERAREAELEAAREALRQSQKMEAVGQLTGGLAHDFNNLLTGISGSLELMQARMSQGRLTDLDRYMTAAQGAARRAAALTHRLLAFSRRQTLDPKPTDVNALVHGMEELIRRTVGPSIHVEVVGAAGLWLALVDPPQLENALLNLCVNARDAMPDGGRITVETANRWLDARAALERDLAPGQYLSLCVTDTGTGMTPDVVARAFDPFFTTKPLGEGTGLGLSMIYGFARQSGGHVRIYSEVGQGTTMYLYLPRHHGEAEDVESPPDLASAPRAEQGETVLIVDDEPSIRMLVTEVLEDLGYTAIEAADAPSGLRVLQSDVRIDLLVTDVGLPGGMNGRQMADAGRVNRRGLKVLFITGYAENAAVGNGHLEHGMQVLTKPFEMETLASRIKELIAGR
jgi:PAS domain S-box-containing protein